MINETISIPAEELNILNETIGKRMNKIITDDSLTDFIWTMYFDFGDDCIKIDREDIVAKYFDTVEDGGRHKISKCKLIELEYTKTINRIVNDVLIVSNIFTFKDYKIQYPRVLIFNFDDCNLIVEKRWIFSLAGFLVRLESLDAENFGLYNETQFWYDEESDKNIPDVTQIIHSLKQCKDIQINHGIDL